MLQVLRNSKMLHQQGKDHKPGADLQLLFDAGRVDLWRATVNQQHEVEQLRKENEKLAQKYEEAAEKMKRMDDDMLRKSRELEQKIKRAEFEKQQVEHRFEQCATNAKMMDSELKRYSKMLEAQDDFVNKLIIDFNQQLEIAFPED